MVLVIFADAVEWMDDRNAMTFQLIARTDAREHENLRRVIHARAEYDFVRSGRVLIASNSITHAGDGFTAENQRSDLRVADDR